MGAIRKTAFALGALTIFAALADALLARLTHLPALRLFALLECLALMLGAFAGLTQRGVIALLRKAALRSAWIAAALPFAVLVPYLIMALGDGVFRFGAMLRLAGAVAIPTLLLLPDRTRAAERAGWRDFAAMLALALPLPTHWLAGVWAWPSELYFFRPVYMVVVGAYDFLVVRNLQDVGYRLTFGLRDAAIAIVHFAGFAILAIPLGMALHFIHPHRELPSILAFFITLSGVYLTVAIPEELFFRGILQNFLSKSFKGPHHARWALIVASVIFGLSHLHHAPVPNWRYAILATLAGLFYGHAYDDRRKTSASALTHALVDTVWHFWF